MGLITTRRGFLVLAVSGAALAVPAVPAVAQLRDLIQEKGRSGGTQPQGGAQGPEPAAIVRRIFEDYRADKDPDVPWSPAVRNALRRADISADPILQAQDIDVKSFTVREVSRKGDAVAVEVRFLSFGRNMHSRFDFRLVDGKWVIGNYRILSGAEATSDLRREVKLPPLR